jgi:hypothetical protein
MWETEIYQHRLKTWGGYMMNKLKAVCLARTRKIWPTIFLKVVCLARTCRKLAYIASFLEFLEFSHWKCPHICWGDFWSVTFRGFLLLLWLPLVRIPSVKDHSCRCHEFLPRPCTGSTAFVACGAMGGPIVRELLPLWGRFGHFFPNQWLPDLTKFALTMNPLLSL